MSADQDSHEWEARVKNALPLLLNPALLSDWDALKNHAGSEENFNLLYRALSQLPTLKQHVANDSTVRTSIKYMLVDEERMGGGYEEILDSAIGSTASSMQRGG